MELEPVFLAEESRNLDSFAINEFSLPSVLLMGQAASSIFTFYQSLFKKNNILILCGSGNNGGDGLALACLLINAGHNVHIFKKKADHPNEEYKFYENLCLKSQDFQKEDNEKIKQSIPIINDLNEFDSFLPQEKTLIIDCILGTGFTPPLKAEIRSIIRSVNILKTQYPKLISILSIDTPSGYFPEIDNEDFIKPDYLAEIGVRKLENTFISYKFETTLLPIGLPITKFLNRNKPKFFIFPEPDLAEIKKAANRKSNSNKYKNGAITIIGGSEGMSGAVLLAQKAFHVSGGGISKIFTPSFKTIIKVLKNDPSMMVKDIKSIADDTFIKKSSAIIIGPGLHPDDFSLYLESFIASINENTKIILDAGGIIFASSVKLGERFLLTPHTGEFARLIGAKREIQNSVFTLKKYCIENNVNVLLKDYISILCDNEGNIYIFSQPNDKLAVMGTGDMLTGFIARFISIGYPIKESVFWALSLTGISKYMKSKHPTASEIINFIGDQL